MSHNKEVIKQKYFKHIDELNKIETTELCVLKKAMEKYKEQTTEWDDYVYNKAFWKHNSKYCVDVLEIHKMNARFLCSKERLDAIDFNIIYDYTNKTSMEDRGEC